MTFPEFDALFDGLIYECIKMRDTKGREYANSETDRLANFKEIAQELGIITTGDVRRVLENFNFASAEKSEIIEAIMKALKPNAKAVLMVYMQKHIRSIQAYVKTGEIKSNERIMGRLVDLMTYAGLLWGLENDKKEL